MAVESLLEYCYKDRFDRGAFENGYSRNLLWRLWELAKLLEMSHSVKNDAILVYKTEPESQLLGLFISV